MQTLLKAHGSGVETKLGLGRASDDAGIGLEIAPADRETD